MTDVNKNYEEAEKCYQKSLLINPNHRIHLENYQNFKEQRENEKVYPSVSNLDIHRTETPRLDNSVENLKLKITSLGSSLLSSSPPVLSPLSSFVSDPKLIERRISLEAPKKENFTFIPQKTRSIPIQKENRSLLVSTLNNMNGLGNIGDIPPTLQNSFIPTNQRSLTKQKSWMNLNK